MCVKRSVSRVRFASKAAAAHENDWVEAEGEKRAKRPDHKRGCGEGSTSDPNSCCGTPKLQLGYAECPRFLVKTLLTALCIKFSHFASIRNATAVTNSLPTGGVHCSYWLDRTTLPHFSIFNREVDLNQPLFLSFTAAECRDCVLGTASSLIPRKETTLKGNKWVPMLLFGV